jgi:hypothetical protein
MYYNIMSFHVVQWNVMLRNVKRETYDFTSRRWVSSQEAAGFWQGFVSAQSSYFNGENDGEH